MSLPSSHYVNRQYSPDNVMRSELPHYEYLDALRGVAILLVMIIHAAMASGQIGRSMQFFGLGQRGVQLFYVISAFTLYASLSCRSSIERHTVFDFYIRRFFRIAPMFYLALLANVLYRDVTNQSALPLQDILLGITFLHGISAQAVNSVVIGGWSIAIEASFYAVLPLIFAYVRTLKNAFVMLTISAALFPIVSRIAGRVAPGNSEYFDFTWFPIEFPVFCMGIFAYYVKDYLVTNITMEARKTVSIGLISLCLLLLYSSYPPRNQTLYVSSFAFVPLLIALAMHPWRWLVNRYFAFLGKISYSIYLVHFFVVIALQDVWGRLEVASSVHGTLVGFALFLFSLILLAVPISYATWRWIERPGIAVGRRLISNMEGR